MEGSPLEAIAYIKGHAPAHDPAPIVQLDDENAPVLKNLGGGLLVAYLMDQGDGFAYVQGRHLRAAGIDADELHARAVANLGKLAEGRVTIRQNGPTWALFCDGNVEASLMLLDEMWDGALSAYHAGEPAIALPARDVVCFCNASSAAGVAELRAVIKRVWPQGDHLISNKLFRRRGQAWLPYEALA
jgi:uncharacterized protein YtpQ (UPF0354 family)